MNIYALILAAGKGTRMPSQKPKVMQTLLGDTMLACVYKALTPCFDDKIFTLLGYKKEFLLEELLKISPLALKRTIEQKELLGTGHAMQVSLPYFVNEKADYILVINGDVPLISSELIEKIIAQAQDENCDLLCTSIMLDDVENYGRIVREHNDLTRDIIEIVEAKDYKIEKHGIPSGEINVGLYVIKTEFATKYLPLLKNNNANKEYYITDLVSLGIENNCKVSVYNAGYDFSLLGANNPYELMQAEENLRKKRNKKIMEQGVILHNPDTITIGQNVEIRAGVEIFQNCIITGKSFIDEFCVIEAYTIIKNTSIAANTHIASYSHLEEAKIGKNCKIGPYARLRPLAELNENVHVGNFVEIKKSVLGNNTKANHLSYIGDAKIGSSTNIGAGTITCNYDGKNKYLTEIGDNCFIGSNTALVAPVELKNNVLVGAGSVITKNVAENELVVARSKQVHLKKK